MEDVKFVINFDYPNNSEDYVHRIGRTGRSQATGTAYTFFTPGNAKQANDLISVLQEANQIVAPKLLELADNFRGGRGGGGGGGGSCNFSPTFIVCGYLFMRSMINCLQENLSNTME